MLCGADLFHFFEKFRQFPNKNIYKTKINIEESSERKLTEKTFVPLAAGLADPSTRSTKVFLYKFLSRFLFYTGELKLN